MDHETRDRIFFRKPGPDWVQVSFAVPRHVRNDFKVMAAVLGVPVRGLGLALIEEYLEKNEAHIQRFFGET